MQEAICPQVWCYARSHSGDSSGVVMMMSAPCRFTFPSPPNLVYSLGIGFRHGADEAGWEGKEVSGWD